MDESCIYHSNCETATLRKEFKMILPSAPYDKHRIFQVEFQLIKCTYMKRYFENEAGLLKTVLQGNSRFTVRKAKVLNFLDRVMKCREKIQLEAVTNGSIKFLLSFKFSSGFPYFSESTSRCMVS